MDKTTKKIVSLAKLAMEHGEQSIITQIEDVVVTIHAPNSDALKDLVSGKPRSLFSDLKVAGNMIGRAIGT